MLLPPQHIDFSTTQAFFQVVFLRPFPVPFEGIQAVIIEAGSLAVFCLAGLYTWDLRAEAVHIVDSVECQSSVSGKCRDGSDAGGAEWQRPGRRIKREFSLQLFTN